MSIEKMAEAYSAGSGMLPPKIRKELDDYYIQAMKENRERAEPTVEEVRILVARHGEALGKRTASLLYLHRKGGWDPLPGTTREYAYKLATQYYTGGKQFSDPPPKEPSDLIPVGIMVGAIIFILLILDGLLN